MSVTCKHCAHYKQSERLCYEWYRTEHRNSVKCDRFVAAEGARVDERPFTPMIRVTITPDSESEAHGGSTMPRKQVISNDQFDEALRLREEENLSPKEIAERLGEPLNRVRYMLNTARRRRGPKNQESVAQEAPTDVQSPVVETTGVAATVERLVEAEKPASPPPGPDLRELERSLSALGRIVERIEGRVGKSEDRIDEAQERIGAVTVATARELQLIRESVQALRRDLEQLRIDFTNHGHLPSGDVALPIARRETA